MYNFDVDPLARLKIFKALKLSRLDRAGKTWENKNWGKYLNSILYICIETIIVDLLHSFYLEYFLDLQLNFLAHVPIVTQA